MPAVNQLYPAVNWSLSGLHEGVKLSLLLTSFSFEVSSFSFPERATLSSVIISPGCRGGGPDETSCREVRLGAF